LESVDCDVEIPVFLEKQPPYGKSEDWSWRYTRPAS